jgi:muramoyltetrapeptide carboxypeptidase
MKKNTNSFRCFSGDQVSVVAPSFFYDPQRIAMGMDILKGWGLRPHLPEHLLQREWYFSGSDEHRIWMLHQELAREESKVLWCARGGFGSARLLPLLSFDSFLRAPKLLIGFSDITALSLALYARCGLPSVHGPMIGSLSWDLDSTALLRELLLGRHLGVYRFTGGECLQGGKAKGVLLGGNLSVLTSLLGTPYLPDFRDSILFLEEVDEKPYRIDRMLTQLELAGVLDRVAGVVIGQFTECTDSRYDPPRWEEVLRARLGRLGVPVRMGFPGGHEKQNWPLLMGAEVTLDASQGVLSFQDSLSRFFS